MLLTTGPAEVVNCRQLYYYHYPEACDSQFDPLWLRASRDHDLGPWNKVRRDPVNHAATLCGEGEDRGLGQSFQKESCTVPGPVGVKKVANWAPREPHRSAYIYMY
jgi:hypothetical protein